MSPANEPARPPVRPALLGPRRMRWLILLILVGPCAVLQAPLEVGRWKLAAAVQARADGEKQRAYAKLAEVMRWMPNSPLLYLQRAKWRADDGAVEEALNDNNQALALGKSSGNSRAIYSGLKVHGDFLQKIGRFAEAVPDWKEINELSERSGIPPRSEALNGLAYAQALAKVELDQALQHVNDALELAPNEPSILDTRGYLHFLQGHYAAARTDMDLAIKQIAPVLAELQKQKRPAESASEHQEFLHSHPIAAMGPATAEDIRTAGAVMYYHRALVLEALGEEGASKADRDRAKALIGREPDETLY